MSPRSLRWSAVPAVALLAAVLLAAGALAHSAPRAHLRLLSGAAHLRTVAQRVTVSGSFTVTNTGTAATARFHAWVQLSAAGHVVVLERYRGGPLGRHARRSLTLKATLPRTLARRNWAIQACAASGTSLKATPAPDGCRRIGSDDLLPKTTPPTAPVTTTPTTAPTTTAASTTPSAPAPTSSSSTTAATTTTAAPQPPSPPQVPTSPLSGYSTNSPFFVPDGLGQYEGQPNATGLTATPNYDDYSGGFFTSGYWAVVPPSYPQDNQTPETLVVWMHGCGGVGAWDAQDLTGQFNSNRPYILISLNGPEQGQTGAGPSCWDTSDQTDVTQVLTDITNAETHFNIDRRRVIIAGYSSGGDLAYQTIFLHADLFAGILAVNTDPVRDNTFADNINAAIAAAAWKFNIRHVAHTGDETYPLAGVSANLNSLSAAGFPVTEVQLPGTHYDNDAPDNCQDSTPSTCTSGTSYDIVNALLDTVGSDGWESPAS